MTIYSALPFLAFLVACVAPAQIVLERTSCFGTCPAYQVEIRPDGTVFFTGSNQFAQSSGNRKIDPEVVDSLTTEILRSGFAELADSYQPGERGCKAYATDHPSIRLTVRRGLYRKSVSYNLGCYGDSLPQDPIALREKFDYPPSARALVRSLAWRVDGVAGVDAWLRKPREGRQ